MVFAGFIKELGLNPFYSFLYQLIVCFIDSGSYGVVTNLALASQKESVRVFFATPLYK